MSLRKALHSVTPHLRSTQFPTANKLVLNLDKTNIMKFKTSNSSHSTLHIGYKEKYGKGKVLPRTGHEGPEGE
jgi:hypothetical protein